MELQLPADMPKGMGNCGIVGTAIFCGVSHDAVWNYIKKTFKKPGNWKGSSYHGERAAALKAFNKKRATSFKTPKVQLKTWARDNILPGHVYMVRTTKHIQCLSKDEHGDVWVADQSGVNRLNVFWGKGKTVQWAMCRKV